MSKKEEFKNFINNNPQFINIVHENKKTWQDIFNDYLIFGNDLTKYNYLNDRSILNINDIPNIIKKIDMNNVQKHINNAQKAINLIQDLSGKSKGSIINKTPSSPQAINNFFED